MQFAITAQTILNGEVGTEKTANASTVDAYNFGDEFALLQAWVANNMTVSVPPEWGYSPADMEETRRILIGGTIHVIINANKDSWEANKLTFDAMKAALISAFANTDDGKEGINISKLPPKGLDKAPNSLRNFLQPTHSEFLATGNVNTKRVLNANRSNTHIG
jgi:hypothetical protein